MSAMPPKGVKDDAVKKADDQKKQQLKATGNAQNNTDGDLQLAAGGVKTPEAIALDDDGFSFVKEKECTVLEVEELVGEARTAENENAKVIAEDCYAIFDVPCPALYLTCCDLVDLPLFALT